MPGIMPDVANGGVVVRTLAGVCTAQSEAPNAYCPPATFVTTCQVTALAEDCTARVMPSQLNAIVSELMCLAVALDPNGPWDCNSNCNLSAMFQTWAGNFQAGTTVVTDGTTIAGNGTSGNTIRIIPDGVVSAICADDSAADALATCLISGQAGNIIEVGSDGRLFAEVTVSATNHITGTGSVGNPLDVNVPSLISTDGRNIIREGTDGLLQADITTSGALTGSGTAADPLTIEFDGIASFICGNDAEHDLLASCLVSAQVGNELTIGTDGGLYVVAGGSGGFPPDGVTIGLDGGNNLTLLPQGAASAICADANAAPILAACLISAQANNSIVIGTDGKIYYDAPDVSSSNGDGITISEDGPFSIIPLGVVNAICSTDGAGDALASCLRSTDGNNTLTIGTDGRLFVANQALTNAGDNVTITQAGPFSIIPEGVVNAICGNANAREAIAQCIVSFNAGQDLTFDPDGRLYINASTAVAQNGTDGITIGPMLGNPAKIRVIPGGVVTAICGDDAAADALATCMLSTDANNSIEIGSDGRLFSLGGGAAPDDVTIQLDGSGELAIIPGGVVNAICANDTAGDALASCLRSTDANNGLVLGTDGRLFVSTVTADQMVANICGDDSAHDALADCLLSTDSDNILTVGTDGGLKATAAGAAGGGPGGPGTSWQSFLGSRVDNTWYQNTSGAPIEVSVVSQNGGGAALTVNYHCNTGPVDNIVVRNTVPSGHYSTATWIVPNNHYYKIETGMPIDSWKELR